MFPDSYIGEFSYVGEFPKMPISEILKRRAHKWLTGPATAFRKTDNALVRQRDLLCNTGTTPAGIPLFHCHDASMRSLLGPFGPGRRRRLGENHMRYFLCAAQYGDVAEWEGFRTMAERRTRAGRMNSVHKPAMIRSAARRLGARLPPRLRMRS
jgi:hypothetical protein